MAVALLDINVLIALAWPNHVHNAAARLWFARESNHGWATCPLTQCGFVRISSNPKIIVGAVKPSEALALLQRMAADAHHQFWPDDLSLTSAATSPWDRLSGHRQVTDTYLFSLCLRHGGKIATLDGAISSLARDD